MTSTRTLLLLRHATAEPYRSGHRDADRRLSPAGRAEADGVKAFFRERGWVVDRVLCSPAVRTRETLARLELTAPVERVPELYQAGADQVLELAAAVAGAVVLVVGHAPAVPEVVHRAAEHGGSSPSARAAVSGGYPPATLARLELDASFADLTRAKLVGIRLANGSHGSYLE